MPEAVLHYRLTIRNADDTADDLVITSIRTGTNPYIADPPSGDGQEVDPITGVVRTGSYNIQIIDAITSGTNRVMTSKMFDTAGRQVLLSRRSFVELSDDNGATWEGLISGYLIKYRLVNGLIYELQIGDTRRIENTKQVFDGVSGDFARRGCIFGGPMFGSAWGPITARGGWRFRVKRVTAGGSGTWHFVAYDFISGFRGVADPASSSLLTVLGAQPREWANRISDKCNSYYSPNVAPFAYQGFPGLVANVQDTTGALLGQFTPGAVFGPGNSSANSSIVQSANASDAAFNILWDDSIAAPPTVGDTHLIHLFTRYATSLSPVYVTEHPVDILTKLWDEANVAYSATAAADAKAALGATLRVSLRITTSTTLKSFIDKTIFGPFGLSARTNSDGELEVFLTRLKGSATPTHTVMTADLQGEEGTIFDNDESSVVTSVRFKTKAFWAADKNLNANNDTPLDCVIIADVENVAFNNDVSTYSTKEVVYEFDGMIHDDKGLVADMEAYTKSVALEVFDRFGRGAPTGDFPELRQSDDNTRIGDEVYLDVSQMPNYNKRIGDDPSVGARIVQIVRRTETPEGPVFKYVDAGSAQQPVVPAAVITIGQNLYAPQTCAEFTITNAAAINATLVLTTAIQYATGASAPDNGVQFIRYGPNMCPTGAVQLPSIAPGTKVWARARTEQDGRRPSAWTAWVSVTLDAVLPPTGLTVVGLDRLRSRFLWTNVSATDLIDVYAILDSVAPADWTPYLLCTLPPGTEQVNVALDLLGGGAAGQFYYGAVAHRDPATNKISSFEATDFTSVADAPEGVADPIGIAIKTAVYDATMPTGIMVLLYPRDISNDMILERAPDVAGAPGSWEVIGRMRGSVETYIDRLPYGGTFWYRMQQARWGYTNSPNYTEPVQGSVSSIQSMNKPPSLPSGLQVVPLFGIIGDGVAAGDDARAQAAIDYAEAQGMYADFGVSKIAVSTGLRSSIGVRFDTVAYGDGDGPGFYCVADGITVMTMTGRIPTARFAIHGGGHSSNALLLDNCILSQFENVRVYDLDGFGVKKNKCWDCLYAMSIEKCGNATDYAYSMNDDGDTCNMSHVLRLQVEFSNEKSIFISPNTVSCVFDNIHSERATPDIAYPTWVLGGNRCIYNGGRFTALVNPEDAQVLFTGYSITATEITTEGDVDVSIDSYTTEGHITLNNPTVEGTLHPKDGQEGRITINEGRIANVEDPTVTFAGIVAPSNAANTNAAGVFFNGTNIVTAVIGFQSTPNPKQLVFTRVFIGELLYGSLNATAIFDNSTIKEGGHLLPYETRLVNNTEVACASAVVHNSGTLRVIDSTLNAALTYSNHAAVRLINGHITGSVSKGDAGLTDLVFSDQSTVGGGSTLADVNLAPTAGAHLRGETHWWPLPSSGGTPAEVCVTAGTPGTWKAMANLA